MVESTYRKQCIELTHKMRLALPRKDYDKHCFAMSSQTKAHIEMVSYQAACEEYDEQMAEKNNFGYVPELPKLTESSGWFGLPIAIDEGIPFAEFVVRFREWQPNE